MSGQTWTPHSEEEAVGMIASAASEHRQLRLVGSGTKSASFADETDKLSSLGLSGIVAYNPAELVITAKAGTPMTEIQATLDEHRQMLSFEPGSWGTALGVPGTQTIGGIAAANQSGSRRFLAGAARDSLLGVRFVNGQGEIIKNGGRVMKNVTGLDLVKLLGGSWGSLGFLTEVSFKVLPCPVTEKTLAIELTSDVDATPLLAAAMATSADISGAAHLPSRSINLLASDLGIERPTAMLRFEGFEASVDERIERVKKHLPTISKSTILEADVSKKLWANLNDLALFSGAINPPLWKLSLPPTEGIKTALALSANADANWFADWQGGLVWIECAAPSEYVRQLAKQAGGHATLMRLGADTDPASGMFQPQSAAATKLSEAVRHSLDPKEVFRSPMTFASNQPLVA
ncbi:MAG: FAD-binding protein [Pseudomonadota bacterium]